MTDVKKFLGKTFEIERGIHILETALEREKTRSERITRDYSGLGVHSSRDPHGFDGIVILEDEIRSHIDKLARVKAEIISAIESLENPVHRQILLLPYIHHQRFPDIAVALCFSERQTFRIHGAALTALTQKLKEKENEYRLETKRTKRTHTDCP